MIKFTLGLLLFFVSAVYVVLLILGLWFINQADYRSEEEMLGKAAQSAEMADEDKNELKVNVSKLPSDDQQDLQNSKITKRTISRDDGKILQAVKYLNFIEKVQVEMETESISPVCELICDTSSLDPEKLATDPYIYAEKFYIRNKNRALEDFYFRHAVESTQVVALILTPRMREMYIHGLEIEKKNIFEQIAYVTKFQFAAAQSVYNISQLNKNFQNHEKKMAKLIELRGTCEYTSAKKVQQSCFEVLESEEEPVLMPQPKPAPKPEVPEELENQI